MFFFVFRGGSYSIQIPTSASSVWSSSAHVGGIKKKRVRVGDGGWRPNEEASSSEKPTFKQINHMSKGIKAAFEVFQGWKVVQKLHVASQEGAFLVGFGAGEWVLLSVKATKSFAKGLKVSQKVLSSALFGKLNIFKSQTKDLPLIAKGFNYLYAAIKIVQFTKSLGRQPLEVKLRDGDSIWKGYKFSKRLLTILDPVVGKNGWAFTHAGKGFLLIKTTVGGIGVALKATLLSKEICVAVLQKLAISGGTFAASRRTGYQRNHIRVLADRSQPKRLSLIKEGDFCNLLSASFPCGSLSNDSLFSLTLLFRSFAEETESPVVRFSEDDHQFMILCLAIPLPSSEILVFV